MVQGFETLNLKRCELKLWELTVWCWCAWKNTPPKKEGLLGQIGSQSTSSGVWGSVSAEGLQGKGLRTRSLLSHTHTHQYAAESLQQQTQPAPSVIAVHLNRCALPFAWGLAAVAGSPVPCESLRALEWLRDPRNSLWGTLYSVHLSENCMPPRVCNSKLGQHNQSSLCTSWLPGPSYESGRLSAIDCRMPH